MTIPIEVGPREPEIRRTSRWMTIQGVAILWAIAILVVCWTPRRSLPVDESFHRIGNFDKLVHGGIFAVFGFLAMAGQTTWRRAGTVLVIGIALAAISEIGQQLPIVGRDGSWADGLADAIGLVMGVGLGVGLAVSLRRPGLGIDDGV